MKHLLKTFLFLLSLSIGPFGLAANYERLATPLPPQAVEGKVVVQQFLWHQCIHCYHLEPQVEKWQKQLKPDFVEFERVPVAWSQKHLAQGAYYTLAKAMQRERKLSLADLDAINAALFDLHFVQKKTFTPENALPIFQDYGVATLAEFITLLESQDAIDERMKAHVLTRDYQISSVPVFVVNGKYLVSFSTLEGEKTPEKLFATINQLAEQERQTP